MDIKQIIESVENKKQQVYIGRKYYYYKPNAESNNDYFYQNGEVHKSKTKNQKEIYTNWFKVLVNQKLDYSLSNEVTIEDVPLEFNVEDILDKITLNASLDSKSWIHLYINNQSKLDWIIIQDNEIIDIWDSNNKYITNVIRFFNVKSDNKNETITHVEIWDSQEVTQFEYNTKDKNPFNIIRKTHYMQVLKYQDIEEAINPKGFGFIPFIPLFNNKNHESDVESIEILLDAYNEISTGFINNVRKFQEALMKLKGYGGQNLEEFSEQLKKYNVIPVDENGDFDYVSIQIPVEARSVLLDLCKKNIFILGRGVDPTDNFGGSNITNVLIKAKYNDLNNKCSEMEKQIRLFYFQLITYINTYYNMSIDSKIIFNRSQIFNESETIDNCVKSMGLISNKTIVKMHPWTVDADEELKLISEENRMNEEINNEQIRPTQSNFAPTT